MGSDVSFSVQIHLGTSFQNEINKSKLYFSIWDDCFNVDAYFWDLQYEGYLRALRPLRGHEDVKICFLKNVLLLSAWVLYVSSTSSRSQRRLPNVFHSISNFILFFSESNVRSRDYTQNCQDLALKSTLLLDLFLHTLCRKMSIQMMPTQRRGFWRFVLGANTFGNLLSKWNQ